MHTIVAVIAHVSAPLDTTRDALDIQVAAWRAMGGNARASAAIELSESIREISAAGIAKRHPEYSQLEVKLALFRLLHGDELFSRAWPTAPLFDA